MTEEKVLNALKYHKVQCIICSKKMSEGVKSMEWEQARGGVFYPKIQKRCSVISRAADFR
jgi:hypothetical protein